MKRIRVTVTQDDIDKGRRMTALACPLARALRRATGEPCCVVVGWTYHGSEGAHTATRDRVALPAAARAFVLAIDRGDPVKPATFLLPVPE